VTSYDPGQNPSYEEPSASIHEPKKRPNPSDSEGASVALVKILDALRPLSPDARSRVVLTAATFFDLDLSRAPSF
jgi:hypothetical protein